MPIRDSLLAARKLRAGVDIARALRLAPAFALTREEGQRAKPFIVSSVAGIMRTARYGLALNPKF